MNKDKDFLEQLSVSFFLNVKADKHSDMSIGRVLRGIKNCAYQKQVINARYFLTIGEVDKYADAKGKLPAVTFCGTFTKGHKAEECEHYNNLLVIDIDKLDEPGMIYTEECLKKDPYIAAYWQSPSGHGYKGLVHLSYDESFKDIPLNITHKTAFQQMFAYLLSTYGIALDRSGSDVSRLCYMSSDEDAVIKEEAMAFKVKYDEMTNNAKHNVTIAGKVRAIAPKDWNEIYCKATGYKDNIYNRNLVVYVLKKLTKRHLSITETWEDWVKVAFAIASSLHPEKGKDLFLQLCRLDGVNHDEAKSERLIWDAYSLNKGRCSIKTIKYLARQKGILLDG